VPVEVDDVPEIANRSISPHQWLYDDVLLRLEQTHTTRWLCYENMPDAETLRQVMYAWFRRRYGSKYVRIKRRGNNLYVQRGARWYKP